MNYETFICFNSEEHIFKHQMILCVTLKAGFVSSGTVFEGRRSRRRGTSEKRPGPQGECSAQLCSNNDGQAVTQKLWEDTSVVSWTEGMHEHWSQNNA